MERVISYIDGFNLYFGLRSKGWKKYYWLDLVELNKKLLKDHQGLTHCHYFTSRIRKKGKMSQNMKRQGLWLDAIESLYPATTHYGHYLEKTITCRKCMATWKTFEEKMTDVNMAVQLLSDAYEDKYDTAILISGDSDLAPPIEKVLSRFPQKKIIVCFPPGRHSDKLRKVSTSAFTIGEAKIRKSLLPENIKTLTGHTITRPKEWK